MAIVKIVPMPGPSGNESGGNADIADFTFTNNGDYTLEGEVNAESEISLHNKDFSILTTRDVLTQEEIDQYGNIDADINLRAADDIFITAQGDEATIQANNNVTIVSDYQEIGNYWEFNKDGRLYLPNSTEFYDERETVVTQESMSISTPIDYLGNSPTNNTTAVYLEITETSSWMADNFNNRLSSTITFGDSEVLPLIAVYQANIGETQAMIFQWDGSRDVAWPVQIDQESNVYQDVASASIRVPIINSESEFSRWIFSSDGSITLPRSGIISNGSGDIVLDADDNVYLRDSSISSNRVATIGDLLESTSIEQSFTVNGGTLGIQPTFAGPPMFSGSYVKSGPLVYFQIQVDMDNITSFGTGQYYVDLPFFSKYGQKFREGCLHDISTGKDYEISGHVDANSKVLTLSSVDTQSGTVFDIPFVSNSPIILENADNFHISGTYIAES